MWLVNMWDYIGRERTLEATPSVPIGSITESWREVIGVCVVGRELKWMGEKLCAWVLRDPRTMVSFSVVCHSLPGC
jgi:hypothetical protein